MVDDSTGLKSKSQICLKAVWKKRQFIKICPPFLAKQGNQFNEPSQ
jgi:hypothetical protein